VDERLTFGTYDLPFLYNPDGTGGWSGANRRDDVMLVQTLLDSVFGRDSIRFGNAPISGNVPGLTVDGQFGAKTAFA